MPAILADVNAAKHDAVESTLGSFSKNVGKNVTAAMSVSAADAAEMLVEQGSHAMPPPKRTAEKPSDPYEKNLADVNAAKHDAVESTLGSFSKNVGKNVTAAMSVSAADAADMLVEQGAHHIPPPQREEVKRPHAAYEDSVEARAEVTGGVVASISHGLHSAAAAIAVKPTDLINC